MNRTNAMAALFGCTPQQILDCYAKNATQLEVMAKKAAKSGKKLNGYTAEELSALAHKYYGFANSGEEPA